MAGKTGSDDGAQANPTEPVVSSDDIRPLTEETRPDDRLGPGEPSWPEDPAALRVEAPSGGGVAAASHPAPAAEPAPFFTEGPGDGAPDAEPGPATPGRAGPPWDWETPSQATPAEAALDQPRTVPDAELVLPDATATPTAASATAEPPRAGFAPVAAPPSRRGIGGLLLGGMIAAALGFGAAWLARDQFGPAALPVPADLEERLAALESRAAPEGAEVEALAARLNETEARLQALEDQPAPTGEAAAPADLEPLRQEIAAGLEQAQSRSAELEERLAALEAQPAAPATTPGTGNEDAGPAVRADAATEAATAASEQRLAQIGTDLSGVEQSLSDLQASLASLEERVGQGDEALAALESQVVENTSALEALDARLGQAEAAGSAAAEEARAAAATLAEAQARAAQAETQARTGAALAALDAALDGGEPFEGPLSELEASGTAVPDTLAQAATAGVPTLASLRENFPDAARAGLAAAREAGLIEDGGVLGFLSSQLSVRSTTPREGDDPDAILSRAEAALAAGHLDRALQEIAALPEPVRAAMADWIARARTRAEAEAALASLREAEPDAAPAN